ncbi:MAG: succinate dehydrogenase, hydrophobic membrane anchor protein [Sphingomonas sp.]|uniref:succinate dehydrogenase, hydrophobic membrane anchor protein n=1 Tax=Sphingomonas sp. TaxID=28214 RepID=UPI001227ACCD|nr:succinate dehydrogenase, hydrophobic membrane anchor protein [Sphingomonas sp.]THD34858.1 MAG: succinate dehydrogenase, hydrophobic membrane anchor protein [Sphingomonas sp.]
MGDGTELGRVRGLGSAHEGAHHWWRQRLTAGSNLFFLAWFMISLTRLNGFDYLSIHSWIGSAWVAVPMILLVISTCWHARLGLQVLIEDYQEDESRVVGIVLLEYFLAVIAVTAIFAILKAALTPVAG